MSELLQLSGLRLTVDLNELYSLTRKLSRGTESALWLALIHRESVMTASGPRHGWSLWSIDTLISWGLNTAAARAASKELSQAGFVSRLTRDDGRQFAVFGPRLIELVGSGEVVGEPPTALQSTAFRNLESAPPDLPNPGSRNRTEVLSSGIQTTEVPGHRRLLHLLRCVPEPLALATLAALLDEGSERMWAQWVAHPTLGPALGTPASFASCVRSLAIADSPSVKRWLDAHSVVVRHPVIGSELNARVVFALVDATASVKTSPAGWLKHMSESGTQVKTSLAAIKVVRTLTPYEPSQGWQDEDGVGQAVLAASSPEHALATVRSLPLPEPDGQLDDQTLAMLRARIPSLASPPPPVQADEIQEQRHA